MDNLEHLYENLDEFIKKEPSDLIKAMEDNIEGYYQLTIKEEKINIILKTQKGVPLPYSINMKDPLILLRFYYQARNKNLANSGHWKTMKLYLIEENGKVIKEVNDTDTIESLKSGMSLAQDQQLYFSYKRPEKVQSQQKGGKKRKRKKKKKKAFPSRKKNNRKNRTKKKTLSK